MVNTCPHLSEAPHCTQAPGSMSTCASAHRVLPLYWHCSFIGPAEVLGGETVSLESPESVEGINKWSWTDLSQKPTSKHTLCDGHCFHILTHFIFATPPWSRYYYPKTGPFEEPVIGPVDRWLAERACGMATTYPRDKSLWAIISL